MLKNVTHLLAWALNFIPVNVKSISFWRKRFIVFFLILHIFQSLNASCVFFLLINQPILSMPLMEGVNFRIDMHKHKYKKLIVGKEKIR